MTTEASRTLEDVLLCYLEHVDDEIGASLALWPPDFTHIHVHEVIGGMVARQATLAKEIAGAPSIWNGHTAPILLRAMADVHINLVWLMLDPPARCLKYISYGLGQAKLELEHRRAQMDGGDPNDQGAAMIDGLEQWIDSQRATFLQDVDLGKWSGLSVRDMAKEADCVDFYNYVYTPFSGCAHSMWRHVATHNLEKCGNPLHRHHRVPMSPDLEPDLSYMLLAAKYWDKSLSAFTATFGLDRMAPSARQSLLAAITPAADAAAAAGIQDPAPEGRDG